MRLSYYFLFLFLFPYFFFSFLFFLLFGSDLICAFRSLIQSSFVLRLM